MSDFFAYLQTATSGWREFVTVYKGMPLVIASLLYVILSRKGTKNERTTVFFDYVIVVTILLTVPVTAVFFM